MALNKQKPIKGTFQVSGGVVRFSSDDTNNTYGVNQGLETAAKKLAGTAVWGQLKPKEYGSEEKTVTSFSAFKPA